jgi:hypothetical protein
MTLQVTSQAEDWNRLNQYLNEEAVKRDWCSDYDKFLDLVNRCTTVFELYPPSRDYEITYTARVTSYVTLSHVVSARDEDSAQDQFDHDFDYRDVDADDITWSLKTERDWQIDDFEVVAIQSI